MFVKLYERNLSVIPVVGKATYIKNWSQYSLTLPSEEDVYKWEKTKGNIGIVLGPASNLVCLDIDTDDQAVLDACPRSPVVRRGMKGEARFFKYTKNIISEGIDGVLDILSIGCQVVVPPSIHPDTKLPYRWITPDTLENFDQNDLPELDLAFLPIVEAMTSSKPIVKTATGRNNKLVDIVSSMRGRGEDETKIITEVYEWDKKFHSPRLFTDSKERYRASNEDDAKRNAWVFVNNVTSSLIRNGVAQILDDSISIPETKPIKHEVLDFPKPKGILKDIMDLTLDMMTRDMPNLALGGAIATLSVLCANRFRFQNTWPNVYVLNLAPSGAGKSFPQIVAKRILGQALNSKLLGYGGYKSSSALVKNLVSKRERLDIIDEIASLFMQMKSGGVYQMEIIDILCQLWSDSSEMLMASEYSEKTDTSTCYNPCVSILGSSTIEGIKQQLTGLMTQKGLMPRFLIFSHEEYGKTKEDFFNKELFSKLIDKISLIYKLEKNISPIPVNQLHGPCYDPIDVYPSDPEAVSFFKELKKEFDAKIESASDEPTRLFFIRGIEQVSKLATLHCVGCGNRQASLEDLVWARDVFYASTNNSSLLIQETSANTEHERDYLRILGLIKKRGSITIGRLYNAMRSVSKQKIDQLVEQLVAGDQIVVGETKPDISGRKSRLLYAKSAS
jgi:hypothetical protein